MNCVKRKLKSTGGASIIIALFFFLICCTVGVSVLTAAKANASRLVSQRESEEAYLAVRSAAMLTQDKLETVQMPFAECREEYGVSTTWSRLDSENSANSFWGKIEDAMFSLLKEESDSESCNLIFKAENMPDVSANITISKKAGSNILEGQFSCIADPAQGNANTYFMTLTETWEISVTEQEPITRTVTNENGSTTEKTVGERREYTISFNNGQFNARN